MHKLTPKTRLYILGTLLLGAGVLAWQLLNLRLTELPLLAAVCVVAGLAQVLKVEGATAKSSYNISWVAYGFAFARWGAGAALVVITVAHLGEWVYHRYPWYIQSFNIASYALALQAAALLAGWLNPAHSPAGLAGGLSLLAFSGVFTLANHLLVGMVLRLARGESFAQSGVFGVVSLMIDVSLLGLGAASAVIWQINPFLVMLTLVPLYLIYSTLKVPNLQRQTQVDAKTGLYNSRYLVSALEQELARANRFDRPLTVVMADLDLLRNINNTYGHLAGDTVLIGMANLLRQSVREFDVVARFGGEEFCILMPETAMEEALPRLESIRAAVEAAEFTVSTSVKPIRATMSFGVAGRPGFGQTATDILHAADVAVYRAKLQGRNRVCPADGSNPDDLGPAPVTRDFRNYDYTPPPTAQVTPPAAQAPARASRPAPAETPAAPPAASAVVARPAWMLRAYIGGLAIAAMVLLALASLVPTNPDWFGIGVFLAFVLLSEGLAIDIYARDTSVSTSAAPFVAGALMFGPWAAALLTVVVAAVAMLKHRSPISRFIFNASNHLIGGLLCVLLVSLLPAPLNRQPLLVQALACIASALILFASNTPLIAGAVHLSSGQPLGQVWRERFGWLAPYYVGMGMGAFALMLSYQLAGLVGALTVVVPLLVLRLSQKQYIERTKDHVVQLRRTNEALSTQAEEITRLNEELLIALSNAIDLRDPQVNGHSRQVARYAVLVAEELGLLPERVELVRKAGLLHDIGKLGIADRFLTKPARLTADEYSIVQQHSVLGEELISACHSLHALRPLIRHHHERVDGAGYPDSLAHADIPIEARILSLADAVEAMATDRPYRNGLAADDILGEIRAQAGKQFDPEVVQAFCRVVEREGLAVIVNSAKEPQGAAAGEQPAPETGSAPVDLDWRLAGMPPAAAGAVG